MTVGALGACDQGPDPFSAARDISTLVEVDAANPAWPSEGDSQSDTSTNVTQAFEGLVINEVAPAGAPEDWVELYNGSGRSLDLSGFFVSDDPGRPMKAALAPGTRIEPGQHVVVLISDATLGFKLGSDESLTLSGPDGLPIDFIDWDEGAAPAGTSLGRWPDGRGSFRQLIPTPGGPNAKPEEEPEPEPEPEPRTRCGNGRLDGGEACDGDQLRDLRCVDFGFEGGELACASSCQTFDTSACLRLPVVDVVLNEVCSTGDDLIEVLNRGADPVELAGWSVTDDGWVAGDPSTDGHRWLVPAGTILPAGERMVLTKGLHHPFGLGDEDSVALWDANGELVDETRWGRNRAKVSWCRVPDATGDFAECPTATFGAANPSPSAPVATRVIIDELYYDEPGQDGPNVFTALWGPPGTSLDGWALEGINGADDKVYRTVWLTGGIIPAHGRLVIADADATGATLLAQDLVGNIDWQNGPDAVRLVDATGQVVDAVQYGVKDGFARGEGTPAPQAPPGKSLRRRDHIDTDDNAADFEVGDPRPGG